MRKKLMVFLLALVSCITLTVCLVACNNDETNGNNDNSATQTEYKEISISINGNNFEAGSSYDIKICADGNFVNYDSDFVFTVVKNFNYATVTNGRLYIDSQIDDKAEITLYVTHNTTKSNTLSIIVSNIKNVNDKEIAKLETQLERKRNELEDLKNQLSKAEDNIDRANEALYDYQSYCISMGYMSYGGDWLTNNSAVRNKYNGLYSNTFEASAEYNRIYSLIEEKEDEIREIENRIYELR